MIDLSILEFLFLLTPQRYTNAYPYFPIFFYKTPKQLLQKVQAQMSNERFNLIITESTQLLEKRRQTYEKMMLQRQSNPNLSQQYESQIMKQAKLIEEKNDRLEKTFESLSRRLAGTLENVKLSQCSQQNVQISNMEANVKKLELQVSLLQKENGSLKEKFAEKDIEIGKLKRQLDERYAQNQNYSTQLIKVQSKLSLLAQALKKCSFDQKSIKNSLNLCKGLVNFQKILPEINKQRQKQVSLSHQFQILKGKMKDEQLQSKARQRQFSDAIYQSYSKIAHITSLELLPKDQFNKNVTTFTDSLYKYLKVNNFLPDSDIIQDRQGRQWLMSEITSFLPCYQPIKTKKLYHFDPLNKTNFHNYFDQKPNILIIVKLSNNFIVGGFTHFPFHPKNTIMPGKGFIFNLNSRLIFHQKSQHQLPVTQYDDYYFALGNAELRIKSLQLKLFSNFGIGNGIFDRKGMKRIDFMGCEQSQIDIDSYEIYQILQ